MGAAGPLVSTLPDTGARTYYVDSVGGSDLNDGSITKPFATLAGAEVHIPLIVTDDVLITVVSSGAQICPPFRNRLWAGGQVFVRTLLTTTVLASTAALASSSISLIKSSGLTIDQYTDNWVHVLTGAAAGDYRLIKQNTATDITPVRNFTAAVGLGDLYEILTPVVQLSLVNNPIVCGPEFVRGAQIPTFEPCLNFENFLLTTPNTFDALGCSGRVAFWRCKASTAVQVNAVTRTTQMLCGVDQVFPLGAFGPQRVYGGSSTAYLGAGYVNTAEESDTGGVIGYINSSQGLMIRNAIHSQILGGRIRGDHFTIESLCTCQLGTDAGGQLLIENGQTAGVRVRSGGFCYFLKGAVNCTGGIGLDVETGGQVDIAATSASVQITGSTYGIRAWRGGGRVYLHEGAPAVTGGTAKYAVGEAPATSNSLPNVGDTLVAASLATDDGSRITRVE